MVDMRDNREISDVFDGDRSHARQITPACRSGKARNGNLVLQVQ
jgi:hypothetical protein